MAEQETTADTQPLEPRIVRLRHWAKGHPVRSAMIGGGLLLLAIGTIATWVALASLAAPRRLLTLDDVFESLDAGDDELAVLQAKRLNADPDRLGPDEHGGPLYVIGVVKAREADRQPLPSRAHELYELASGYLTEARKLGVPDHRDIDALYHLGRTLTEAGQYGRGIKVLDDALLLDPEHAGEIHRLLGEAHFYDVQPDSQEVLDHLSAAIDSGQLTKKHEATAHLKRALTLARLGRFDEGLDELAKASPLLDPAERWYAESQVRTAAAEAAPPGPERQTLVQEAHNAINSAQQNDPRNTRVTGGARYLRGRLEELTGTLDKALNAYVDVRLDFSGKPEGIAASLAEADLLRKEGLYEEALEAYRRTAVAVKDESKYRSDLLTLGELHDRFMAAKASLTAKGQFAAALSLVDHLAGLFDYDQRIELRGAALETWGRSLLDQADRQRRPPLGLRREGRRRLREAGQSFERLSEVRYATESYPEDLWRAAEAYHLGHSFTGAKRVLLAYLTNEPRRRNALALQRLGQAHLALGRPEKAIKAFLECIEFYPRDAASFGARLNAARAYRDLLQPDRAEELLLENLVGSPLKPSSPEWRDSKLELGHLLHDRGRYEEAINSLEDAVAREERAPGYQESAEAKKKVKVARYLAAEAYRRAAEEPMKRYREAKSVNDREKSLATLSSYLNRAIRHYERVQRDITLHGDNGKLDEAMLRNCYMLRGSALFDLGRYEEAVRVYSNVSTLYQSEPFVLETMVQIHNCWRRLNDAPKARGAIEQAVQALDRLPETTDFLATTSHTRAEWQAYLTNMRQW